VGLTELLFPPQYLVKYMRGNGGAKCPRCRQPMRYPSTPEDLPVNVTLENAMQRLLGREIQVREQERGLLQILSTIAGMLITKGVA
jgi:hypothetical protein